MLFDWFTFGAQTLNFLMLVWLMKRFLYKPILSAIDAREKRIALTLADAAEKQAQAQKERDEFEQKNAAFAQERNSQLQKLQDEIKAERQRLLAEARQTADALRVKKREALTSELQTLHEDIARRSREEVLAIAQKVLADLADLSLEERMSAVFTDRLRNLDDHAKTDLATALNAASNPVCVRSAFELSAQQRTELENALNEAFSGDIQLQFNTAPELISGIELTANGWKLAWNIADFLAALEQCIHRLIKEQPDGQAHTAAPADAPTDVSERAS